MTDWVSKLDASNELSWYGQGSGGGWRVNVRRVGAGFEVTETLENDFDSLGGANPATTTKSLDRAAATADVASLVAQYGAPGVVGR